MYPPSLILAAMVCMSCGSVETLAANGNSSTVPPPHPLTVRMNPCADAVNVSGTGTSWMIAILRVGGTVGLLPDWSTSEPAYLTGLPASFWQKYSAPKLATFSPLICQSQT